MTKTSITNFPNCPPWHHGYPKWVAMVALAYSEFKNLGVFRGLFQGLGGPPWKIPVDALAIVYAPASHSPGSIICKFMF